MACYHQKILSAIPSGNLGKVVQTPAGDSDIGGAYKGDFATTIETRGNIPTTGTDPIYFNRNTQRFRHYSGGSWSNILPTDNRVLGSTNNVWLGQNNGVDGSADVVDLISLLEYLENNDPFVTDATVLFYYDGTIPLTKSGRTGFNVQKVTSYDGDIQGQIIIENNSLDKSFINKAVTFDGNPFDIKEPRVRLALDNEMVIGSILGYSKGKLQVAVNGWDIKFINGTSYALPVGSKIVGKTLNNKGGYIQPAYDKYRNIMESTDEGTLLKSRGSVTGSGLDDQPGIATVKVAMQFGGW